MNMLSVDFYFHIYKIDIYKKYINVMVPQPRVQEEAENGWIDGC